MSGHWPPEWDSPAEESTAESLDAENPETENPDPEFEAQLAEVAAFLAAVPDPVLPPGVEARISAAITAEAQSARTRSEVTDLPVVSRKSRWRVLRSEKVLAAVAACLVFAVAGYFASLTSNSPSESMPPDSSAASAAVPSAEPSPFANGQLNAGSAARGAASASATAAPFVVTMSGTKYRAATLAAQARAELAGYAVDQLRRTVAGSPRAQRTYGAASTAASVPGPAVPVSPPSAGLLGCVEHFTGGGDPRLVDRGTYQGTPVYVIVGGSKVWVVELGCTASHPELLASAALPGDAGISAP